ncbi:MAG: asparaginase [Pseudomonadota bacterium]|nr:asparaginase [Pseudomonadota bacterium]
MRKPRIILLTMGGTISIGAEGVAKLGASALLDSIPQVQDIAEVEGRDVLAKPSSSLSLDDFSVLVAAVEKAAAEADGVVVTHGTDTLEETAFALSLLLNVPKTVVITGAMRKAGFPGSDGPANILTACRVAAHPSSRGKGVLIVMNDQIHAAEFTQKSHSFLPSAFTSRGPLGWIAEDRVRFFLQPAWKAPRLQLGKGRPAVPLVETGIFFSKAIIATFNPPSTPGLVLNMTGVGHVAEDVVDDLQKLAAERPVVFASRAGEGETFYDSYAFIGGETDLMRRGLIPAGFLNGRQARVALILLLSAAASIEDVRAYFRNFSEG